MMQFIEVQPSVENYWRALILFGRNVASYKFALGKSLLDLRAAPGDLVKLEELALPFARNICEHLHKLWGALRASLPYCGRFFSNEHLDVAADQHGSLWTLIG